MRQREWEFVNLETKDSIAVLTINNPPLNILTDAVLTEFNNAVEEILTDETLRVILLRAMGEKVFIAGADINQFPALTADTGLMLVEKGKKIFDKLGLANLPVICAVNGSALGAGLELALACDIRIAEEHAKLGLPETGLGILPGYGGTQRLTRLVGSGKAKEMILAGVRLSAQEAYDHGLVERVVPKGQAFDTAKELAQKIAEKGPIAVSYAKRVIDEGYELSLEEGQKLESQLFAELCKTADMQEGVKAFKEKRQPKFSGK
ncbi:enoyl-CoA hydratase/isomerase family protein [Planococcus lenghuensis]|uniref:Enoyl-CoA hydratase n=1 Tax=Planococcus lenghuensis TaxID=2213202 RepID=A0A1Q2L2S2_9BACL|nr:enoyl-CoA hydratase-related protein [Planococcus lenghuensis]AQQ54716.1 enoyl-CoA hydratase [Planococcus lenghuensis]